MKRHLPALASLALGAVAATGFAPLEAWPLTILAFTAWLWLIHEAPTLKSALWRGWVFGLGHFTVNNNWIQHAFDYQDAMPPALGYVAPLALALYLAVYPMLAAGLAWKFGRGKEGPDAGFALAAGTAWIVTEWLRAGLFTGYAWDPVGVIWVPMLGVARIAAWIGTYALSGLTIVVAGSLLLLLRREWKIPTGIAIALLILSLLPVPSLPSARGAPHVRVVQPNLGQEARAEEDYEARNNATLETLSGRPGAVPRLVLWPEGAVRDYIEDGYPEQFYYGMAPQFARERIAYPLGPRDILLFGGIALLFDKAGELTEATNAIYALDGRARILSRYDKAHLVPYGEYLPMRPLLSAIGLSRIVPGDIDFRDGPGPRSLPLPGFGNVGMQICYEIVFSGEVVDPAHRPAILFNPSNDGWFGSWGPPQHLAQARMRAIEEGLPILRSTPTGISAIVGADGRLLASIPAHRAGAIELPMPPAKPPTLFSRAGNWMAFLIAALLAAGAIAIRRRAR
ncbi:apolipoprotein N-acyltransferase [soil metagenome]